MRKQKSISSMLGKIMLVFLIVFSQLRIPLEVLADEIENNAEEFDTSIVEENDEKEKIVDNDTNVEEKQEEEKQDEKQEGKEELSDDSTTKENDPLVNVEKKEVEESNEKNDNQDEVVQTRNVEEAKYVVTVNGNEVDEFDIGDTKVVEINQSYSGEEGTYKFVRENETIDFTNAIYGDYEITYEVVSSDDESNVLGVKSIIFHYDGDNAEIIKNYTDLGYDNGTFVIRGTDHKLKASDVLSNVDVDGIENNYYIIFNRESGSIKENAEVFMADGNTYSIGDDEEITSDNLLALACYVTADYYNIKIEGDYTGDGIVNGDDAKVIVDNILDDVRKNDGTEYSIIDATNSVFTTGIWDNSPLVNDELESTISNKSEAYVGEEFDVKYFIDGFDKDYLTGIQGKLNYDKDMLELVNVDISNIYGDYNENTFAYLLDNYNQNGLFMTLTFKGKSVGDADISIDDIILSNGNYLNIDTDSISTSIKIVDLPKGGDVSEENIVDSNESTTSTTTNNIVEPVYIPRFVALSSDNYIKSLTIDGYKIDFDMYKYEYKIKVKNDVKSLKLDVVLNDPSATYEVKGNENFKVGENVVEIIVKAENGDTRTYTIKVTRADKDDSKVKEENNGAAKPIIIALIIMVIIGLIYVIFKDDEEGKEK